ncbi:MAG TPA: hypothetical protein VFE47_16535 [Tepidisphaeraceae bacterium]|jgi:hypothetical protein|nr:hypothetical protein [Tepidisphaeraceae bacterium]
MADLKSAKLIYLKGFLFLSTGILAGGLLILQNPSIKTAAFATIAIWSFARFYYFAFYVIQHYVDPEFRFAGLWYFVRYCARRKKPGRGGRTGEPLL